MGEGGISNSFGNKFRSLSSCYLFPYTGALAASPFLILAHKIAGSNFTRKPRRGEAQGCAEQKKGTKEKSARALHPTGALRFSLQHTGLGVVTQNLLRRSRVPEPIQV